jgi:ABC-type multidrug transport system ATPase subunit
VNPTEVSASFSTQNPAVPLAPAVALNEVTKLFGRFAALRAITADFAPARVYALLGDNGAGKSTLLRVIAGLARPTRGSALVLGESNPRSFAMSIGYMGHAPLLYDEMTAMENLAYFARLYGISDPQVCRQAIVAVGLDPELMRRVGQYSQGMRQRLSLARAVLHDPQLLLLDEPFSNVDAASARHMVKLLATMRAAGKTILVVTHQPGLLEGTADESVLMSAGQIVSRSAGIPVAANVARWT